MFYNFGLDKYNKDTDIYRLDLLLIYSFFFKF